MKKTFRTAAAVLLIAALVAGCGAGGAGSSGSASTPGSQTPAPTGAAIKIGGIGPLTGGASIYGNAAKNGAQIAVEEINALGGIQFDLRYQDDEHDPEKAVNAYNTLKDWGMQVSLGNVTSTPAVATSDLFFADRIFALTPSASAVEVTQGKDNVFQICFTDPNQGLASAQYIKDKALGTKIAIIYQNDSVYSTGIYDTFMARAAELGLEIVSTTTFTQDNQIDFSVQLADAKAKGADLVFLPIYYTPASLIFQQAIAMDYNPKYFGVDGMDGILALEGFDIAVAEGVMLLTPFNADATDPRTVSFVEKYKAAHNEIPNQFAADGYDCIYAIYQAIMADGTITPSSTAQEMNDKLIAQFTSFSFDGLTGDAMTWNTQGQVEKGPRGMVIQNGAYVGID